MFLQIDTSHIVNETARYYDAGGGDLLGLLLGSMAVAISALAGVVAVLWWHGNRRQAQLTDLLSVKASEYAASLVELNVDCVSTLKDLSDNLESLRDSGVNISSRIREEIDNTRNHLSVKIDKLEEKIKNG